MENQSQNENIATIDKQVTLHMKKPKRILHFSDGTIEEFSDEDEVEIPQVDDVDNEVVESQLTWVPWLQYKSWKAGSKVLSGCDYVGGALANFLGITTPKFACEIEEFKRIEEENAKLEKEKLENASWQETKKLNPVEVITKEVNGNDRY